MAFTAQQCIDDVSFETYKLLDGTGGSGTDFNLILRWVDQVHKDLLHTSIYRHALRSTTSITSVAGTLSYAITPTDIRRVDGVFDAPSSSMLSPIDLIFDPSSIADPTNLPKQARPPKDFASFRVSTQNPQFYWLETGKASPSPPDLITNGTFASDANWTKNSWTIGSGTANATTVSDDLEQTVSITGGTAYELVFDLTRSAGSVTPKIGGVSGTSRSSAATFTETIVAGPGSLIEFTGDGFTGTLDNVVLKLGSNAHILHLFPAPKAAENAGTVTIYYTKHVATISGASDELVTGEDMRDAIVSGCLIRAFDYLGEDTLSQKWRAVYEAAKRGETVP